MAGKPSQLAASVAEQPDPDAIRAMALLYGLPGHLIRRVQQVGIAILQEEVGAQELTPVQFGAMTAIAAYPGIDATRVSALIAFDRSTLGDVLDRLENRGWIERRPSPQDRRVRSLWLTWEGRAHFERARPGVLRTQERLLAPLPEAERLQFVALLRQLVAGHTGDERYQSED